MFHYNGSLSSTDMRFLRLRSIHRRGRTYFYINLTPSSRILRGITRETVIEIACEKGYDILETYLAKYDLYTADEVLMCSTAGGIFPVIEIDGRRIGKGKPGLITKMLIKEYNIMLSKGVHGTPI